MKNPGQRASRIFRAFAFFSVLLVPTVLPAQGQTENGYWDGRFFTPGLIQSMLVDEAGRLVISGNVLPVKVPEFPGIARWDGRVWESLATLSGNTSAMKEHEGSLFAAGTFQKIGGKNITNIAHFDGSEWHPLGAGTDGPVKTLASRENDLIAGGTFLRAGTITANNIAAWDGAEWRNIGAGLPGPVIAVETGIDSIFAGWISPTNTTDHLLSGWDGEHWTDLGLFHGVIQSIAWHNEALYVAGSFQQVNELSISNVVVWKSGAWSQAGEIPLDGPANTLLATGGQLYAAGLFTFADAATTNKVALVKFENGRWLPLLDEATDGKLIATRGAEIFLTAYPLTTRSLYENNRLIWHFGTEGWGTINNGPRPGGFAPYSMVSSESDITLFSVNTSGRRPLFWDGYTYRQPPVKPQPTGFTLTLAGPVATVGSTLYCVGNWAEAGTLGSRVLAEFKEGSWDKAIDPMPLANLSGLVEYNHVLVAAGTDQSGLWAVQAWDGTAWQQMGGTFEGTARMNRSISSLIKFQNAIFVTGAFTNVGGANIQYFARWDGEQWQPVSGSPNGPVSAATVGDRVYVVGNFSLVGSVTANRLAVWDGTSWEALGNATGGETTKTIAVSDEGLVAIGGDFLKIDGQTANGVAIWRKDHWFFPNRDLTYTPFNAKQMLWRGRDLFICGDFLTAGNIQSVGFTIWHEAGALLQSGATSGQTFTVRTTGTLPMNFALEKTSDFQTWTQVRTNALGTPGAELKAPKGSESQAIFRLKSVP